ncbi:MAG: 4-alpha-glucanotransferase [Bacteroidales bacterium]|nr:4-alpha-glucanotransferase [Bacteroidales bacterium]
MKINISLDYKTLWGEVVVVKFDGKDYEMSCTGGSLWTVAIEKRVAEEESKSFDYTFEIRKEGETLRKEWKGHNLTVCGDDKAVNVSDRWLSAPENAPFYSCVFKDIIFKRPAKKAKAAKPGNVTLKFFSPEIRPNQSIAVVGSGKLFASWGRPVLMDDSSFPEWKVTLKVTEPMEYKFVVVETESLQPVMWENGSNRYLQVPEKGTSEVIADITPVFPTTPWRGAGVAVPVFSLRTEDSFGVGEFHDIKKLVDWAVATGQNIIQLLPINDTTMTGKWQDSYPYNANTTFALHPQFIHLPDAGVRQDKKYKALKAELEAINPELGRYVVDYEKVNNTKTDLLKNAFKINKTNILASEPFVDFVKANESWLMPYAAFCVLRDIKGTPDFSKWGTMAKYNHVKVGKFIKEHQDEIDFHCYEQFLLDAQLKDAVAYAHKKGVAIKGDLPIGISRTSVDAWLYPELFHMNSQAGAPPDAFAADGQNWGFPTYNWEKMSEDGYAWWKARFSKMSQYFDAFRIDHILGFFRIWEIPIQYTSGLYGHFNPALPFPEDEIRSKGLDPKNEGLFLEDPVKLGHYHPRIDGNANDAFRGLEGWQQNVYRELHEDFFYRRHNQFWKETAMQKLPALLSTTEMLTCGEDLGMIPACVPDVMHDLGILSLEIQRMPKSVHKTFDEPWTYPYYSVCATGTHDTSNIRAWWEEDKEATQKFYNQILGCQGAAPQFCEPWIVEKILQQHVKSPSMLCILPLQDWIGMDAKVRYQGDPLDERINVPAIPRYYWRYRMHVTIEELLGSKALNENLKALVKDAGRNI